MRGRVSSAFFVSRDVLFLIGMAAAGLADYMNIRVLYLVSALMLVLAGVVIFFLPQLGQSRVPVEADNRPAQKKVGAAPRLRAAYLPLCSRLITLSAACRNDGDEPQGAADEPHPVPWWPKRRGADDYLSRARKVTAPYLTS